MEILVEPALAALKRLSMDDVHEPQEKTLCLQEEMEVGKYQLRIPADNNTISTEDPCRQYNIN